MARELTGNQRYTRRTFANGSVHYCIQDMTTLDLVKHPAHDYRPFISHTEIPAGTPIYDWQTARSEGGLFDE